MITNHENKELNSFVKLMAVYSKLSPQLQEGVRNMCSILNGRADEDEKDMAWNTVVEVFYPSPAIDLETMKPVKAQCCAGPGGDKNGCWPPFD